LQCDMVGKELQSLIPWLTPENSKIYLKFPLRKGNEGHLKEASLPFPIIDSSIPIFRIINARLASTGDELFKNLFLLVENDDYNLSRAELFGITNDKIDLVWESLRNFYYKNKVKYFELNEIEQREETNIFRSLFYCKTKNIYFHPLCPSCGHVLEQCDSDEIAKLLRVSPITTSLKRYLYCPDCLASLGISQVFVKNKDQDDPAFVKDCSALICEWSGLIGRNELIEKFPCVACSSAGECYGENRLSSKRLVPFSFFNFHLFAFEAAALHLLDFLPFISGASTAEVIAGLHPMRDAYRIEKLETFFSENRGRNPLFFSNPQRNFYEILYLKLAVIGQLAKKVFPEKATPLHPELCLSLKNIWINTCDYDDLLPFWWSFSIHPAGFTLVQTEPKNLKSPLFPIAIHNFAVNFFTILLLNKKQDSRTIRNALLEAVEKYSQEISFKSECSSENGDMQAFAAENLFWNPTSIGLPSDIQQLWNEVMNLGWRLLRSSYQLAPVMTEAEFLSALQSLSGKIRGYLFSGNLFPQDNQSKKPDKERIRQTLMEIRARWQTDASPLEIDQQATLILNGRPVPEPASEPVKPEKEPEDLDKTIIFDAQHETEKNRTGASSAPTVPEETVILSDSGKTEPSVPIESDHKPDMDESDLLPRTIILTPEELARLTRKKHS